MSEYPKKTCINACAATLLKRNQELECKLRRARRLINKLRRDNLTGLLGRHSFNENLKKLILEIKKGKRKIKLNNRQEPQYLVLMMIDLDNFKKINDKRGHKTGDVVLQKVSKELRKSIRAEDLITKGKAARYGGEELVIVYQCVDELSAFKVGEKIRAALENITHATFGTREEFKATVSIGISAINNEDVKKWSVTKIIRELYALADYSLYASKMNGRNTVTYTDTDGNPCIGRFTMEKYQFGQQPVFAPI